MALAALLTITVSAQGFGLGQMPQMGWSTWQAFGKDISAEEIKKQVDLLSSSGLFDLGFNYVLIDDGWQNSARNSTDHKLGPDPFKFPNGMKDLVDYIHNKSMKAGIYSSAGTRTCAGYLGSLGYE